jgi:hypothetical protein
MAVTLLEAAATNSGLSAKEQAAIKMFTLRSDVAKRAPATRIDGYTFPYSREVTLPGIGWRGVNEAWTESTGVINPLVERLQILGGEFEVDKFILETAPRQAQSEWVKQSRMKVTAAARELDRAFLEGDDLVNPKEMVGLRNRLSGNQVMLAGAGGVTLTLAMLDELRDRVPFSGNLVWFMNTTMRRKLNALLDAATGSRRIEETRNNFGQQVDRYAGADIAVVEYLGDGTTWLDFDEDPGDGTPDTTSIYLVYFGDDGVQLIYNGQNGKEMNVEDFGVLESRPRRMGRLETYIGMVIPHPRAAARLRGITNS